MKFLFAVLTLCTSLLLFSPQGRAEEQAPPPVIPVLQAGDQLRLYVYGDEELTGEFRIDTRGILTLPLIGEISAAGMDKSALERRIATLLIEGGYYNDPKVTIDVATLQPFYILGEVRTPGSYPFTADLDVFKAIAIAGGYTPRADKKDIKVMRKVNGEKVKIQATEDTPILPGDSIKVEQRFF